MIRCLKRILLIMTIVVPVSIAQHVLEPVLTIRDLTPKFLVFYRTANSERAAGDRRFDLWKRLYGFAAVPPTPEGDRMARRILDDAWPEYPKALPAIERARTALGSQPTKLLNEVAHLLEADVPVRVTLLLFVGGFDGNAFTAPGADGVPTVAIPMEGKIPWLAMNHEFTHVVEGEQAKLSFGWERSIAHTIFTEGLAMRVTERLNPGQSSKTYTGEFTPNWFARSEARRSEILSDIAAHVEESDSDAVMRYTMGTGGAGIDREAYYAGWLVIGDLLDHGWTFPRLARVTDADMPAIIKHSLSRLGTK